ncbi:MAG: hypothetical protein HYX69_13890 [Planctomycetia bacterium]|nr:hypothetical protein [Planctomycetia bacterium]
MKTLILTAALGVLVASSSGCCLIDRLFGCGHCGACASKCGPYPGCGTGCCPGAGSGPAGPSPYGPDGGAYDGPPTGAVTYPYYTTRGPRDFLAANPRGIGP